MSAKTRDKAAKKSAGKKPGATSSKKGRGKGKGASEASVEGPGAGLSVASHPRARSSVRRIKAGVGLVAFTAAFLLSLQAAVPIATAAERGLIAGVTGYMIAWACALSVWRALLTAELRARVDQLNAQREAANQLAAQVAAEAAKIGAKGARVPVR